MLRRGALANVLAFTDRSYMFSRLFKDSIEIAKRENTQPGDRATPKGECRIETVKQCQQCQPTSKKRTTNNLIHLHKDYCQ